MAFNCKAGTFAIPGSTGNLGVTGVGFQPKAVLLFGSPQSSDAAGADAVFCIGMAVSSSSRVSHAFTSDDAAATSASANFVSAARCVDLFPDGSLGSSLGRADFVSFDTDGFTLNWSVAPGTGRVHYLAFGGDDLTNVALASFSSPGSTGNSAVTGVGFQPDCILGLLVAIGSNSNTYSNFGAAISSSERFAASWMSRNAVATSETFRTLRSDRCVSTLNASGDATLLEADFVSMDSDGFTLNWSKVSGTRTYYALCLKGGQYAAGVDTQKTSTGTKATTGVGFEPAGLLLTSACHTSSSSVQTNSRIAFGAASSATSRWSLWAGDSDNQADTIADNDADTAACLKMLTEGTPTLDAEADLDSFDSDGFTLDWVTADATAREFAYLAFGDAAAGGGGAANRRIVRRGDNYSPLTSGMAF